MRQHEEPEPIIEDDEAEQELQIALQRSRRTVLSRDKTENLEDADEKLHKVSLKNMYLVFLKGVIKRLQRNKQIINVK